MPGNYTAITATKSPQRILTWMVKNESVTLVNNDLVNTVFIGNDPSSQPIPIAALGSVTINYSGKDTWLSTGGVNVLVQVLQLPQGTQWAPAPSQVAASISALGLATATNQSSQLTQETATAGNTGTANNYLGGTTPGALVANSGKTIGSEVAGLIASGNATGAAGGSPPLRFTRQLQTGTSVNIPAAATTTLFTNIVINQPGYECVFTFNFAASSGTIPFANLIFTWSDNATGLTLKQKLFIATAGSGAANALSFYVNGPCCGNRLTVAIQNLDPAFAGTLTYVVNQTSHTYLMDKIVQPAYATGGAPNGFTNPNGTPSVGILASIVAGIAPNTSLTRLLAVYSGRVNLALDNLGGLNACRIRILDPTGSNVLYGGNANQSFFSGVVNASAANDFEFGLPNGPVLVELHNQTATNTITPACTITPLDY